jgi:hypothetical protein
VPWLRHLGAGLLPRRPGIDPSPFHVKFIVGRSDITFFLNYFGVSPIPVAEWSKVWVCGRSLAWIAGLNPAGGVAVSYELCVVR